VGRNLSLSQGKSDGMQVLIVRTQTVLAQEMVLTNTKRPTDYAPLLTHNG
jgi:hypothetical protein